MWYMEDEDGICRGFISSSAFDALSSRLKDELKKVSSSFEVNAGQLHLTFRSYEDAEEIGEKISKAQKNADRAESRRQSMYILSEGVYESRDIDELFEIQNSLCYYTMEPLSREPKDYHIDHIQPISDCGDSWPGNLALVLRGVNQEKSNMTKRKFLNLLRSRNGDEWYEEYKKYSKSVDIKRRKLDKKRKSEVYGRLQSVEDCLIKKFPNAGVKYRLCGSVVLEAGLVEVEFPAGFLREKKKCYSVDYLSKIVDSIITI